MKKKSKPARRQKKLARATGETAPASSAIRSLPVIAMAASVGRAPARAIPSSRPATPHFSTGAKAAMLQRRK